MMACSIKTTESIVEACTKWGKLSPVKPNMGLGLNWDRWEFHVIGGNMDTLPGKSGEVTFREATTWSWGEGCDSGVFGMGLFGGNN